MTSFKKTYKSSNPAVNKKIALIVEKKKIVNTYIREGKDLKTLNDKGIKLKLPL